MQNIKQFKKIKVLLYFLAFILMCYVIRTEIFLSVKGDTIEPEIYTNSISGVLWVDMFEDVSNDIYSGDGTHQAQESSLSSYSVSLYKENDRENAVSATQTDAFGKYEFVDLEPGTYVVGIAVEAVNGTEYLVPLTSMSDNKFARAYDAASNTYIYAYTDLIEIAKDSVIVGIDAGMRTSITMQPRWMYNNYEIYDTSNTLVATCSELWSCAGFIEGDTATEYTIVVKGDDSSAGGMYISRAGVKITITSDGGPNIIGAGGDGGGWGFIQIVGSGSELVLKDIILDNSVSSPIQIGIQVEGGGTLTMESGAIVQNYDTNFGAIMLSDSTFNMNGGAISGSVSQMSSGGAVDLNNCTFNMNGGTIRNNAALSGGGVFIKDGVFTMSAGSIVDNETGGAGGGVFLRNSTFNMFGGTISGNTALSGGGMQLAGGAINMSGGKISGNDASGSGGGINVTPMYDDTLVTLIKGYFTITGGEIDKNTAASGGGVYISPSCSFTMKNNETTGSVPEISGNSATDDGGGVYVHYNIDGEIGIFDMSGGIISSNQAVGTDESLGGGIAFCVEDPHNGPSSLPIFLTGGEISSNKAVTGGGIAFINTGSVLVEFIIDGTVIGGAGKANEACIFVNSGGTVGGNGGGVSTTTGAAGINLIMKQGTISYNKAEVNGGGVYCYPGTSFEVKSGTISDNTANGSGGGVFFHTNGNSGIFSMIGGDIRNNNAYEGGALYICAGSNSSISGGTISGNKASNCGGGINFKDGSGKLTISGGTISANEATNNGWGLGQGGGIYVLSPAGLSIRNTVIENNSAPNGGGGIFTTKTYQSNVPGYYENLDIDASVTFQGNTALKNHEPPKATTIATFFSTVKDATNTVSTSYTHTLNHFDINRTQYKIEIAYLNEQYNSFNPPYPVTKYVMNGDAFTFSDIESINGYAFVSWRATGDDAWRNNTTVELDYVLQDTDIFLYHILAFQFYKVDENKNPMEGVEFALYKWTGNGEPDSQQLVSEDSINTEWMLAGEFTSVEDGLVSLPGGAGIYHLVETKTWEGYQLPQGQWRLAIDATGTLVGTPQLIGERSPAFYSDDGKYYLLNYRNTDIAYMGAMGTQIFTISGSVLIGIAVLLGFNKKRSKEGCNIITIGYFSSKNR